MSTIPLTCKSCGSNVFKVASEPNSLDDLDGAECANCGATFDKHDVEDQAKEIATDPVKDAFRKAGLG